MDQQEDSFNEYLNLSRIEHADRPQREMVQPPSTRQPPPQPPGRPGLDYSLPMSPGVYSSQLAQPEAMNFMMQQMLSNPMMSMMMAQMQMMQQQMLNSGMAPTIDPMGKQPQPQMPRNRPAAPFGSFETLEQPTMKQSDAYQQPRLKKVSVRAVNVPHEAASADTRLRSVQLPDEEHQQRQSNAQLPLLEETRKEGISESLRELHTDKPSEKKRPEQPSYEALVRPQSKKEQPAPPLKKPIDFDDIPIRPMKSVEVYAIDESMKQPMPQKPKPANHFDQQPVGGKNTMTGHSSGQAAQLSYEQIKMPTAKPHRSSEVHRPNPYREIEERPVKGVSMNFEELLEQKIGKDYHAGPEASNAGEPAEPRASNFLKKGSRQFLSSAKYRVAGQSQTKEQIPEQKVPLKKVSKQPTLNSSILREEDSQYKSQSPVPSKSKQTHKRQPAREKSPAAARRKLIDTDEHPLERSEPRRQKVTSKYPPYKPKKDFANIFEDEPEAAAEEQEVLPGIRLQAWQLAKLREHLALESESVRVEEQRLQKLRSKYEQMLRVLEQDKERNTQKLQQERDEFEEFKKEQLKQIKNERRVAERQKQAVCSTTNKKEKEELEVARKQWEKEKEDFRKRENSSRILVEKLKRQVQELKRQLLANSQTSNIEQSKKQHTRNSDMEVSVEKDCRETKRHINAAKRPVAAHEDRSESKEQPTVGKALHKSILNTEGKFSEPRHENKASSQNEGRAKDPMKGGDSAYNTANSNSFNSKFIPDYEDLKTDRAKNQPIGGKGAAKNTPTALEPRHKQMFEEDRSLKSGWQPDNRSRSNLSGSEQEQFEPYSEDMQVSDLNSIRNLSIRMVTPEMIDNMLHYYNTREYQKLQQLTKTKHRKVLSEEDSGDKVVKIYADGVRETLFRTGIRKEVLDDYTVIHFKNKDIKQKLEDGTTLYYFSEKEVDQLTLLSRVNIFRFDNDQVQFHFPDGRIQIRHADGSIKVQRKD